ncbi:trypco2 family protein [Streptomyces sp. NPDC004267]|uniref:trypco2 family protein n=1 Tax=Streptomyces sp. NPDC004267 TaxID=3364694 RepID=UPI003683F199
MAISLSEALKELREELYRAQDSGAGQQFQFEVEKAELEVVVQFRKEGSGKVKVSVGPAGVEGGGGAEHTSTQKLTLTLNILDEAVGGQRARIRHSEQGSRDGGLTADDSAMPEPGASGAKEPTQGGSPVESETMQPRRPWDQ